MSVFSRVRQALARVVAGVSIGSDAAAQMLRIGWQTAAGQPVSEETAMTIAAVYAAVQIRSSLQATIPIGIYRKDAEGKKTEADQHPAVRVTSIEPNPDMTPKVFWELLEVHRLLWGNCYAEIVWDLGGNVRELWPLEPWRVRPHRENGELYFVVDGTRKLHDKDIFRLPHMSFDGVCGRSVISWAAETLGLSLAAQHYGATFFGNGGVPSGVLEHPGKLDNTARKNIRDDWRKVHAPAEGGKSNEIAVLWEGMKYAKVGLPPNDSQFLETRKFQIAEVSRYFKVPLHMLGDLANAHFDNIESQQIEFVQYSLLPDLVQREQEIDRKLLSPPRLYSKHNVRGMLRGDMAAQSQYFREMFGIGYYSINEIKELQDENPIGPDGDKHFVPMNMVDLARVDEIADAAKKASEAPQVKTPSAHQKPGGAAPGDGKTKAMSTRLKALAEGVLGDTIGRMLRKEANAATRAAEKPSKFLSWMDEFYSGHRDQLTELAIRPVEACLASDEQKPDAAQVLSIAKRLAARHVEESRAALLAACECPPEQLVDRVAACVAEWESTRPKLSLKEIAA